MDQSYLSYTFNDNPDVVSCFDEAPLWSAQFGLLLLEHIPFKANARILDLGSGAGFPLFEIAERFGPQSTCIGLDPWTHANDRARKKKEVYCIQHVEIIEGKAEAIPLDDDSVDYVISNLGVNNFENLQKVFQESYRILKSDGLLILTTNINGHWKEFYDLMIQTVYRLDMHHLIQLIELHQEKRGSVDSLQQLFLQSNFYIQKIIEKPMNMRFANGTAFLNHHFIKMGWLESWKKLIPEIDQAEVFALLEKSLNQKAEEEGELRLIVPMVYMEGKK